MISFFILPPLKEILIKKRDGFSIRFLRGFTEHLLQDYHLLSATGVQNFSFARVIFL